MVAESGQTLSKYCFTVRYRPLGWGVGMGESRAGPGWHFLRPQGGFSVLLWSDWAAAGLGPGSDSWSPAGTVCLFLGDAMELQM